MVLTAPLTANVTASSSAEVELIAARGASLVARAVGEPRRFAATDAPFLTGAPLGVRFLTSERPRALALGAPAGQCPGAGLGGGDTVAAAAAAALRACFADLDGRAACGCRLVAADDVLLAPVESFAYAPGVGGRLIGAGGGAGPLTVEERATQDPQRTLVAFFDVAGPVAVAELAEDGGARLMLVESGAFYEGRREPRGWRRGRIAERLLLTGEGGRRIIALIGFEPADIAAEGPGLAAWPGPLPGRG